MKKKSHIQASASAVRDPGTGKPLQWFKITNEAESDTAEITIYDQIGKDWWSGEGVDFKGFAAELKKIPTSKAIKVRINSPGGNVWDGLPIYNLLKERGDKVTTVCDGIAASIASIIFLAGATRIMPKNAMVMIHDPRCVASGTAKDMREMAATLDTHTDSLVSVYVGETGQDEEAIRAKMSSETWFTGQEALDFGLATNLTDEVQISAQFDFSRFRNVPHALSGDAKTTTTQTTETHMKRVLLDPQAHAASGGGGSAAATSGAGSTATATPNPDNSALTAQVGLLQKQITDVTAALERERRSNVERKIDGFISEGRIVAAQRDTWVKKAIADESVIEAIAALPVVNRLPEPLAAPKAEMVNESIADISKEMNRLREPQNAFARGANITPEEIQASAAAASQFHTRNQKRMSEILNANSLDSNLKRQVILQEIIRAFRRNIAPLSEFSTVYSQVPLQGTDVITVPYFALESTASTDFVAANGYVMGDSTLGAKTITVNKRKYQPIRFTSQEFARQPAINMMRVAEQKAEKLGADIFADVLSLVTLANYGASTVIAAASITADTVITVKGICDAADWPQVGRSLFLNSAYDVQLSKDQAIKYALNYGGSEGIRQGQIPVISGFNYRMCNYIPANGQSLGGFAAFSSGIIAATSPIMPSEEVRKLLAAYEVVTDPVLGISFEYRRWGNADMDESRQVIECSYGYAAGEAAAIKRITTA